MCQDSSSFYDFFAVSNGALFCVFTLLSHWLAADQQHSCTTHRGSFEKLVKTRREETSKTHVYLQIHF